MPLDDALGIAGLHRLPRHDQREQFALGGFQVELTRHRGTLTKYPGLNSSTRQPGPVTAGSSW